MSKTPSLSTFILLAAIFSACAAALLYSPLLRAVGAGDIFALLCGGLLLIALGLRRELTAFPMPGRALRGQSPLITRRGAALTLIGALCLLAMSALDGLHMHVQAVLFCAGLVLVAVGLGGQYKTSPLNPLSASERGLQENFRTLLLPLSNLERGLGGEVRKFLIALVLTILFAFGLRIINLENCVHIWVDEAHFVEGVTRLWHDPHTALLHPMNQIASFTWFYAYLQTFAVDIFGTTLAAPRLVSVVFGTLTIPAVYLLARTLFDRPTGLMAALMLALFPPHIHFSRLAMNNIADPLFGVLAMAFFARGLRDGQRRDFVLAGLCLGLTQYWYEGGKLVYPVVMVLWILAVLVVDASRLRWRSLGLMLVSALLAVLPLLYAIVFQGVRYLPRLQGTFAINVTELLLGNSDIALPAYLRERLMPAWYHLFHSADSSAHYYGGATALILPYLVPLFILGGFYLLWRWQWLPLIVIVLTALGNSVIQRPDWSARFVVVMPFLTIIMAVGVRAFYLTPNPLSIMERGLNKALRIVLLPLSDSERGPGSEVKTSFQFSPHLSLLILLLPQVVYYFGPHLTLYNQQIRPYKDHQDVGWRARDLPEDTHIFLFTDELVFYPHYEAMQGYWGRSLNIQAAHPLDLMLRGAHRLPRDAGLAFFVQPENRDLLRFLSQAFTLPPPQYSPYNMPRNKQYVLYYLPSDS